METKKSVSTQAAMVALMTMLASSGMKQTAAAARENWQSGVDNPVLRAADLAELPPDTMARASRKTSMRENSPLTKRALSRLAVSAPLQINEWRHTLREHCHYLDPR